MNFLRSFQISKQVIREFDQGLPEEGEPLLAQRWEATYASADDTCGEQPEHCIPNQMAVGNCRVFNTGKKKISVPGNKYEISEISAISVNFFKKINWCFKKFGIISQEKLSNQLSITNLCNINEIT